MHPWGADCGCSELTGCMALQLTALGNPRLLERVSAGLQAINGLFSEFDLNHDQQISHEEFNQVQTSALRMPRCLTILQLSRQSLL